jgi:hypothetical protein
MFRMRIAPGAPAWAAALLLGTAGVAGCALTEERTGREAREDAYERSFYDPSYESIFSDPPYAFEPFGRDTREDVFGRNGIGRPDLYPAGRGDESLLGIEPPNRVPAGEPQ